MKFDPLRPKDRPPLPIKSQIQYGLLFGICLSGLGASLYLLGMIIWRAFIKPGLIGIGF